MSLTSFPEPKDLPLKFEDMVLDGKSKSFQMHDVSNPHPGFGKDPNVLNEYGHTIYPKMVYPQGPGGPGVPVQSKEEEDALLNPPTEEAPTKAW